MTRTTTLTSGIQLFAAATLPRGRRGSVSAGASTRAHAPVQPASIDQVIAARAAGNGLAMRWSADDASLRAAWDAPSPAS